MASIERWTAGRDGKSRWRARWRTPAGESRSQVFDRKVDAQRFLSGIEHNKLAGSYIDPALGRTTLREYWTIWSERQPWRSETRRSVTSYFNRHILPAFGSRPINSIRRGEIETWAARLPVGPATAWNIAGYLSSILKDAVVVDELISKNPARGSKRPSADPAPVVPFTDEEQQALRDASHRPRRSIGRGARDLPSLGWFSVALTLGLGAGLRQGEARGLTVDRIDFLRRQLRIDRQLKPKGDGFAPPKSDRSYRTVPLADAVVEDLARHLSEHGSGDQELVLHLSDGRPLSCHAFDEVWRKLRALADLSGRRFHDTRHTYASVLLSGGVGVPAVAEFLGDTEGVVLETYGHLMPGDHDRARAVVQHAYTSSSSRVTSVSREGDSTTSATL